MPRVGGAGRRVSRLGTVCPRSPSPEQSGAAATAFLRPGIALPSPARSLTHRPVRAPARPPSPPSLYSSSPPLPRRARGRAPAGPFPSRRRPRAPQEGAPYRRRRRRGEGAGARPGAAAVGGKGRRTGGGGEVLPVGGPSAGSWSRSPGCGGGPRGRALAATKGLGRLGGGNKDPAGRRLARPRRGLSASGPAGGPPPVRSSPSSTPRWPRAEVRPHGRGGGDRVKAACPPARPAACRPPPSLPAPQPLPARRGGEPGSAASPGAAALSNGHGAFSERRVRGIVEKGSIGRNLRSSGRS